MNLALLLCTEVSPTALVQVVYLTYRFFDEQSAFRREIRWPMNKYELECSLGNREMYYIYLATPPSGKNVAELGWNMKRNPEIYI